MFDPTGTSAEGQEEKCVCGPSIDAVFTKALLRTFNRMKNHVKAEDKGIIDGLRFVFHNGTNMDFVVLEL